MLVPEEITIEDGAYALDGGSILLTLGSNDGRKHNLVLVQHRIPMGSSDSRLPGRLYLDGQLIRVRSEDEGRLLHELKTASISLNAGERLAQKEGSGLEHVLSEDISDYLAATEVSPTTAIKHLVNMLVDFVESEDYLGLADEGP